jgi:hypothetical protein
MSGESQPLLAPSVNTEDPHVRDCAHHAQCARRADSAAAAAAARPQAHVKVRPAAICVLIAALAPFAFGFGVGYTSPTLDSIQAELNTTSIVNGVVVSSDPLTTDLVGRRAHGE